MTQQRAEAAQAQFEALSSDVSGTTPGVRGPNAAVAALAAAVGQGSLVDLDEWWDAATAEIDAVRAEMADLTDGLVDERSSSIDASRNERTLEAGAVAATIGIVVLVAIGAAAAIAERRRAALEYQQLAGGIIGWFNSSTLPELDGFEAAAAYRPASDHASAGGDWFDLYPANGQVVAVVGDVVGHGPVATADMARIRYLIRGLAVRGTALLDVGQLEARLGEPRMMATAAVVAIDRAGRSLRYQRAGHPPPLVRRHRDNSVEVLDGAANPPLGAGIERTRPDVSVPFEPGDTLILYTDGLIERPGEVITDSIAAFARRVAEAPADLDALVESLVTRADHARDDVALLAVRLAR